MTALVGERRVATRGTIALLGLQGSTRALTLLFALVATRVVEPDQYGRYSVVAAVILVCGFLSDFGTTAAMTRLVSADRDGSDRLLGATLPMSLALGIASWAVAVGYVALVERSAVLVLDVTVAGLALPLGAMATSLYGALDGAGLIARRAVLTAVQGSIVAGAGAAALAGTGDVRLAIAALPLGALAGLVGAVRVARRAGVWRGTWAPDAAVLRRVVRLAGPIAVSGGVTALTMRLDLLLLSVLSDRRDVAAYDLALRGLESIAFVSLAVAAPLLPVLSARAAARDLDGVGRAYRSAMRAAYLLGLPVSILLGVLGGRLADAVVPGRYELAAPMAVLGVGFVLQSVNAVQGALAMASDWLGPAVWRAVAALGVMIVADLALIPHWGAAGAAAAALASSGTLAILLVRLFRAHGIETQLPPAGAVVGAVAMAVTALALRSHPAGAAAASLAVYAFVLAVLREVTGGEVREVLGALRRPPVNRVA